jgi:hypothetical protein
MRYVDDDPRSLSDIMVDEVYYAAKSIRSIESGFSRIQYQDKNRDWHDMINHSVGSIDMHYASALFNNYSHIPVTILIPRYPDRGGRPSIISDLFLETHLIEIAIRRNLHVQRLAT